MKKKKEQSRNELIKGLAVEKGEIKGLEYFIVPHPHEPKTLNGYVNFPKRPVREEGYDGIITYIPVHGGITYAEEDKKGILYGFDTVHCDSDKKPRNDPKWIKKQIQVMIKAILLAKEVELKYLRCVTSKGKAKYADMLLDIQRDEWQNMGVMLNVLGGKL